MTEMANAFKKGDVVVLKSGGPPMTVDVVPGESVGILSGLGESDVYVCQWFKGATAERGPYGEHLLEKYIRPAKK
jgi:uncharacterized protein YodC (DUF2158 family)